MKEIKIIGFHTRKGGVGKTTTAVNIAMAIKEATGKNVLVIDADPQANTSSTLRKAEDVTYIECDVVKWLNRKEDVYSLERTIKESVFGGVYYVTSGQELENHTLKMERQMRREMILLEQIDKAKNGQLFEKLGIEYILFDPSPSWNIVTTNVYMASVDGIIQVIEPSKFSLDTLILNLQTWNKEMTEIGMENNIKGILLNKAKTGKITKDMYELLYARFPDLLLSTIIPMNTAIEKSVLQGQKWAVEDKRLNNFKRPKWMEKSEIIYKNMKDGNPYLTLVDELKRRGIL